MSEVTTSTTGGDFVPDGTGATEESGFGGMGLSSAAKGFVVAIASAAEGPEAIGAAPTSANSEALARRGRVALRRTGTSFAVFEANTFFPETGVTKAFTGPATLVLFLRLPLVLITNLPVPRLASVPARLFDAARIAPFDRAAFTGLSVGGSGFDAPFLLLRPVLGEAVVAFRAAFAFRLVFASFVPDEGSGVFAGLLLAFIRGGREFSTGSAMGWERDLLLETLDSFVERAGAGAAGLAPFFLGSDLFFSIQGSCLPRGRGSVRANAGRR